MTVKDKKFVRPLKPGNLEKGEIYAEVGRAIVNLSDIENWISAIYHGYCDIISHHQSMSVFYGQGSLDKKVKLTSLIVHMKAADQHKKKWDKIIAGLEEHRLIRNLVAHYGLVEGFRKEEQVYLQPPWLKLDTTGKLKGKAIHVAEIRATASALDRIKNELENYWQEIENYYFSPEKEFEDDE